MACSSASCCTCSPCGGGVIKKDAKKIQRLMNNCSRTVLGKGKKARTRTLMTGCKWLYFTELVDFHSLVQLFKIINIGTPTNLRKSFTILQNKRIDVTPARLSISSRSFVWRVTRAWNDLPDYLLQIDKISAFKLQLKRHIIENRTDVVPRRPPSVGLMK